MVFYKLAKGPIPIYESIPYQLGFFEASPEVMQEDQEERFLDRKQKESQRAFGVLMS